MAVDFNQHAQLHKKINFGERLFSKNRLRTDVYYEIISFVNSIFGFRTGDQLNCSSIFGLQSSFYKLEISTSVY